MVDKNLKEERQHGGPGLPASCYRIRYPYPAGLDLAQLECHWHDEMELFRVCQGKVLVQCGQDHYEVKAGELVFINGGELHAAQPLGDTVLEYDAVVFSPEILCGDQDDLSRTKYVAPVLEGKLLPSRVVRGYTDLGRGMLRLFDETVEQLRERPPSYELRVRARLLDLFAGLVDSAGSREASALAAKERGSAKGIKAAIEYIRGNYQRPITLEELAEESHMSVGHFCRLFKKYTFKTPVQYINNLRLATAADLLLESDRKEIDVAFDAGFNSLSYFIDVFKQGMGCTPTEYRRNNRPG